MWQFWHVSFFDEPSIDVIDSLYLNQFKSSQNWKSVFRLSPFQLLFQKILCQVTKLSSNVTLILFKSKAVSKLHGNDYLDDVIVEWSLNSWKTKMGSSLCTYDLSFRTLCRDLFFIINWMHLNVCLKNCWMHF